MEQSEFRFVDRELLAQLVALLPVGPVRVRVADDNYHCLYVRSLCAAMIERALFEGWMIDRSNADSPVAEWDGWLMIDSPTRTFLQIAKRGGEKLT